MLYPIELRARLNIISHSAEIRAEILGSILAQLRSRLRRARRPGALRHLLLRDYRIRQLPNAFNIDPHLVALAQPAWRLAGEADASGRSGRDHVAGFKREDARKVGDKLSEC